MTIQELSTEFIEQLYQTTYLEMIAVVFGIVQVLLATKNHVLLYPAGIISTTIFIYLYIDVKLYAESLLSLYYLVMSIYGWLRWNKNHENMSASAISYNDKRDWLITISIVTISFALMYFVLSTYTDSDVPFWDAVVSAFAWAGMWLLAKHKIENWILLNISNIIAIPLLVYKGIPLTALLTLILFTVAVFGYFKWRKLYKEGHKTANG